MKLTNSFRQNFLRIKIYFDELNMEKITYSEYYMVSMDTVTVVLANINKKMSSRRLSFSQPEISLANF